jgi:hypothetical protein
MQTKYDPDDLDGAIDLHNAQDTEDDEDVDDEETEDVDEDTEDALGKLALAAIRMLRGPAAEPTAIRDMVKKCEAAEAAMTASTIKIAHENAKIMLTNKQILDARARFDSARALESGFADLAKNLRAKLPV